MIAEKVNKYFTSLEVTFEQGGHVYLTDTLSHLKSTMSPLEELSFHALEAMGDCNPYDEAFESYFYGCVNTLNCLCNKDVSDVFAKGVAALSYIGFMEGLIDIPVYNIQCKSDETYIEFLTQGNPVATTQMESVGDNTIDLIRTLCQNGLDDSNLERFVSTEYQQAEIQSQNLKKLIPWVPLEKTPSRKSPEQNLFGRSIQGNTISDVCKKIQLDRRNIPSREELLRFINVDKGIAIRSYCDGEIELSDLIGGTYLIFLHGLLKGIDRLTTISIIERLPMVNYVRETITRFMPTRMDNRYILLGLMVVNAFIGSIETEYFNQYSEETKLFADRITPKYLDACAIQYSESEYWIARHGVPDDVYTWMVTCLKTTVIPEVAKTIIRDESIYPAIGPIRLLFESTEFRQVDATMESFNDSAENEMVLESMVTSLISAVDPSGVESPTSRVDSPVGESGAFDAHQMLSVMENLHKEAVSARTKVQINDIANTLAMQRLMLETIDRIELSDVSSQYANSVIESTNQDINRGEGMIRPYKNIPSFRNILSGAETNAPKRIHAMLTTVKK